MSPSFRQFFMIGICGGYTTFSSFSLQTLALAQDGEWFRATRTQSLHSHFVSCRVVGTLFRHPGSANHRKNHANPQRRNAAPDFHRRKRPLASSAAFRSHRHESARATSGGRNCPARTDGLRRRQSDSHREDSASFDGPADCDRDRRQRGKGERLSAGPRRDDWGGLVTLEKIKVIHYRHKRPESE